VGHDLRIDEGLEIFELFGRVPVFLRAHQEQGHVHLSDLGGRDAHSFAFPETSRVPKTLLA